MIGLATACVILPLELLGVAADGHAPWVSSLIIQSVFLLVVGVILAVVILWALIPRRTKFVEPGVEIKLETHPLLHELIQNVTTQLAEQLPDSIYLTGEANASVAEYGGVLGIGCRRIMCIGLPLVAMMSKDELRAIIAHECAHFYTGDTWLAPRVFTARSMVFRIIDRLTQESTLTDALSRFGLGRVLHLLVTALLTQYWRAFRHLDLYFSRRQEFRSDELAAFIAGSRAVMSSLSKINIAGMILDTFWNDIVYPVIAGGFLPPLAQSFQDLESTAAVQKATQNIYSQMLLHSKTNPNSTHPPLKLRLARLEKLCGDSILPESQPALSLFVDLEKLERDLIGFQFKDIRASELRKADWDAIGSNVHLKNWRMEVSRHRQVLSAYTVARAGELLANLSVLTGSIKNPVGRLLTREQRADIAREVIWKSLALKLIDIGWRLDVRPGHLCVVNAGQAIPVSQLLSALTSEQPAIKSWSLFCEDLGIADQPLANP
jgi:Zn-dependent protease with chaperone function